MLLTIGYTSHVNVQRRENLTYFDNEKVATKIAIRLLRLKILGF